MNSIDTTIPVSEVNVNGTEITLQPHGYNELLTRIEQLESKVPTVDVIYDMRSEDETINHGFTSGIVGGKYLTFDFSPYKKVRVFVTMMNCDCQREIVLQNRNKYDFSFHAQSSSPQMMLYTRAQIPAALNRIALAAYSVWKFNSETGLTLEYDSSSEDFYIYRIEGIK